MGVGTDAIPAERRNLKGMLKVLRAQYSCTPLLGWLLGALTAVLLELAVGTLLVRALGMPKIPVLFGFTVMLSKPLYIPSVLAYVALIYILPVSVVARLTLGPANWLAGKLLDRSMVLSVLIHLLLIYASLHLWCGLSDYRLLVARLSLIAIIVTLSLNVVNGYMGEFSCSHPGFQALGAYAASLFTVLLFVQDPRYGAPLLPPALGPFLFPVALVLGGAVAAASALLVAIPSFKTRGDYLAIISLSFMFIIKSLLENLEFVGGPRGLGGQPDYATLPVVFAVAVICIWIINNFVRSTMGKALNAVRDGELAADSMSVNTRRTKMVAFLFAAFWAGVGGGLFAHVVRYVNPGMFGIQMLAEDLAMVYLGGLNSVIGSIVGGVGFNLLGEALRPLQILKWIIIPILLILVMVFRPTGLLAFREFDVRKILEPREKPPEEVEHVTA